MLTVLRTRSLWVPRLVVNRTRELTWLVSAQVLATISTLSGDEVAFDWPKSRIVDDHDHVRHAAKTTSKANHDNSIPIPVASCHRTGKT